jgi:AraC family transcriptional regulator
MSRRTTPERQTLAVPVNRQATASTSFAFSPPDLLPAYTDFAPARMRRNGEVMSCVTQARKNKALAAQAASATHELLNRVASEDWQQKTVRCSGNPSSIAVSLCSHDDRSTGECEQTMPRDAYMVGILLDDAHVCLDADAQRVIDAQLEAGSCYVSRPGETVRVTCPRGYKALHLRIPSQLLWLDTRGEPGRMAMEGRSLGPVKDPLLLQLARTLTHVADNDRDAAFGEQIVDMLIDRIRRLRAENTAVLRIVRKTTLPNWRLQRVDSYVKEHLSESISLSDMANAAGLSPMHFAAQFRAATGCRPHHYLLLCRLERAKLLMADMSRSMLDIALDVGFHTQAHFTTVFKRLTGKTPSAWRNQLLETRLAKIA